MKNGRSLQGLAALGLTAALSVPFGCDVVVDFGDGAPDGASTGATASSGAGAGSGSSGDTASSGASMSSGVGGGGGSTVDPASCSKTPTIEWATRMGGDDNEEVMALAVDSKGDIYLTGYTASTAFYFDEINASAGGNDGWLDLFVAKVSRDGTLLWSKLLGTTTTACAQTFRQRGMGVALGADDALLIAGRFECTLDFVGDGTGACSEASGCLTSSGASPALPANQVAPDAFVAKIGPTGTFLWGRAMGDKMAQSGWDVAAAPDGGSFLLGRYQGALALSPQMALPTLAGSTSAGFLARFDTDGKPLWGRTWESFCSSSTTLSCRLAADAQGNVYFVGDYPPNAAPLDLGTGPVDCGCESSAVVGRLNADGTTAWARCVGTCATETDNEVTALGLTVSADGSQVFVVGRAAGAFSILDGQPQQATDYDAFVARFDAAGLPEAARIFGLQRDQEAFGVDLAPDGGLLVAGRFRGVLDLEACFIDQMDSLANSPDGFVLGLDGALSPLWGYRFGNGMPQGLRIARATPTGEVVVAGTYTGTVDLGTGPLGNRGIDATTVDVVIAKLAPPAP